MTEPTDPAKPKISSPLSEQLFMPKYSLAEFLQSMADENPHFGQVEVSRIEGWIQSLKDDLAKEGWPASFYEALGAEWGQAGNQKARVWITRPGKPNTDSVKDWYLLEIDIEVRSILREPVVPPIVSAYRRDILPPKDGEWPK